MMVMVMMVEREGGCGAVVDSACTMANGQVNEKKRRNNQIFQI